MRIIRYLHRGEVRWGWVKERTVAVLKRAPFEGIDLSGEELDFGEVRLLPPCLSKKIIAVGLNYRDHAAELEMPLPDEPVIFLKPPTALLSDGGVIHYPSQCHQLDYEAELALVVRKACRDVSPKEAPLYVLGWCCANDITARDLQLKDIQWTRSKSFDTFCPLGPWLETELDPGNLEVTLRLNGEVRQRSSTSMMIFDPYELLSFVSGVMTLEPGDVIMTGTPPGVGEMRRGDAVEVEIEGIGILRNTVA